MADKTHTQAAQTASNKKTSTTSSARIFFPKQGATLDRFDEALNARLKRDRSRMAKREIAQARKWLRQAQQRGVRRDGPATRHLRLQLHLIDELLYLGTLRKDIARLHQSLKREQDALAAARRNLKSKRAEVAAMRAMND